MKKFKKFLAAVVVVTILALTMMPAFAEDTTTTAPATTDTPAATSGLPEAAQIATSLGMLKGDGNGVTAEYLAKPTVRIQAAIMQLRLLGLEADALAYDGTEKFADTNVSSFQKPILAYLKANPDLGWIGDSNGKFNPNEQITAQEYYKVMLVSLGYEYGTDFAWEDTLGFAKAVGLNQAATPAKFTNNDVAVATVESLKAEVKGGGMTLAEKIAASDPDFATKAGDAGIIAVVTPESVETPADVTLNVGDDAASILPKTLKVTYSDKSVQDVAVTWDAVDTTKAADPKDVAGTLAGIDAFKASIKVKVIVPTATLKSVTAANPSNLAEIIVTFNTAIDSTKLTTTGNYTVKVGAVTKTISAAIAAADNKSVTLLMAPGSFAQQDKVDVTVGTGILPAAATMSISSITDTTIPTVSSVTLIGNKQLKIAYSEPMNTAATNIADSIQTIGNYKIDGNYFAATSAGVTTDGKTVTINLTSRLAAGDHTVSVYNAKDYAGYQVSPNSNKVTVATDTTAPTVVKGSATQIAATIEFSKEIDGALNTISDFTTNSSAIVDTFSVSGKVLTINFKTTNPLPTTAVTITMNNITDLYGNKAAALTVSVTAVPDTTRPEIVSVVATNQSTVTVTFSKAVLINKQKLTYANNDANAQLNNLSTSEYVMTQVTDTPNVQQSLLAKYAKNAASTDVDRTKVELRLASGLAFTSGKNYTLLVQGVVDDNPLQNVVLPKVTSLTFPDQVAPTIGSADVTIDTTANTGNKLYLTFSKALDAATATTATNYSYLAAGVYKTLGSSSVMLLSDGKTVMITIPLDANVPATNVANITSIFISGVKDTAGNTMSPITLNAPFGGNAAGATLSCVAAAPKATAANTIVLTLDKKIDPTKVTLSDFLFSYTPAGGTKTYLTTTNIAYDDTALTLTITVGNAIRSDATIAGAPIFLETITTPNLKTLVGTPLTVVSNVQVLDAMKPVGVMGKVYSINTGAATCNTIIDVNLGELLNTAAVPTGLSAGWTAGGVGAGDAQANQFAVYVNGTLVNKTAEYIPAAEPGYPATLRFTVASAVASTVNQTARVVFTPLASPTIEDVSTIGTHNPLAAFDVSAVITAAP